MAQVEKVNLKVDDKKCSNVSALIKIFESNHDDLAPERKQKTVIVSDGGRYAQRGESGTWTLLQSRGDGLRGQNKARTLKKIKPRKGSVIELVNKFKNLSDGGDCI